jgi:hypothetical protein
VPQKVAEEDFLTDVGEGEFVIGFEPNDIVDQPVDEIRSQM